MRHPFNPPFELMNLMPQKPSRRLGVESLENRDLMAGNVTASIIQGSLQITGDSNSNVITVVQSGPGKFTVTGTGTTVNGSTTAKTFTVSKDINIDTNAGNDRVTMGTTTANMRLPQNTRVRMGSGADLLLVQRVIGKDSNIVMGGNTENDIDKVTAKSCTFSGNVVIGLGNGNDEVNIINSSALTGLRVDGAGGNDKTNVSNGTVGNLTLNCGAGDDTGFFAGHLKATGLIFADGGPGTDTATKDPNATIEVSDPDPDFINFEEDDVTT